MTGTNATLDAMYNTLGKNAAHKYGLPQSSKRKNYPQTLDVDDVSIDSYEQERLEKENEIKSLVLAMKTSEL